MPLVPIQNLGQVGIIQDIPPYDLPPNAWSGGNNVRFLDNGVKKIAGYSEVMATIPFAPYYIQDYLDSGGNTYWVAYGQTDIAVWDGSTWTDVTRQATLKLNGAVAASAATITVDTGAALTALDTSGTLTVGEDTADVATDKYEKLTYSARDTSTGVITLTGTTTSVHPDNAIVTPEGTTDTSDSDYAANLTGGRWMATNLNGIVVATNGVDTPQYWPLNSSGIPQASVPFKELRNWPNPDKCKIIRSFRTFLVGLNWTRSSIEETRLVKWSTEATFGSPPVTWDESDATLDAGEYQLADTPGDIIDGMAYGDSFLIYKNDAIYIMNYVGLPYVFSFKLLSPTIGCLTKNALAEYDGGHFFIGNSDFYICNGQQVSPLLPDKLRRTVFDDLNGASDNYKKCFVSADYVRNEMLACYPAGSSGEVNKAIIWNWKNGTFSMRDLPDTSYIRSGIVPITTGTRWGAQATLNEASMTAGSPATSGNLTVVTTVAVPTFATAGTLILQGDSDPYIGEQITYTGLTGTTFTGITRGANGTVAASHANSIPVNQTGDTWDTVSGARGTGNYDDVAEYLVFADVTNTKLYRDSSGNKEDTASMTAYIERTGIDLDDPSSLKFVSAVYPQIEVTGNNSVSIYIGHQMATEEAVTWEGPVLFNPNDQSKVSCRVTGKYFGIKVESTGDFDWKMHGLAFEVKPRGKRGSRMY